MSANEEDGRNAHADNATYGCTNFNGTSQSAYNDPVADISYGYDTTSTTMKPHEMRAITGEPSGIYTVDNPIYSGVPSTSVANIHFDVYDDIRDTRERQKKKLKRRKMIYLIGGMILVLLVIITVTVLGLVLSKRKVATQSAGNQQTEGASKESIAGGPGAGSVAFLMSMTLNETFKPELKDKSSPEYMFFLKNFLTGLDSLFKGDPFYSHCVVSSLSSGSILVDFKVICKKEAKLVPLNLGEVYAKKLDCDCKIGNFKVTTGSVKSKGRQLVTEENEQNSDRNKTTSGENVESKGKNPNSGAAVLKPENQINFPGELIGHCKGASVKAMKTDCSKSLCSVYSADFHKNNSTCDGKVDNFIKCLEGITSCPIIAMMHVGLIFPELTGRGVLPTEQPSNHINGKSEPKDKDGLLQVKQGKSHRSDTSFSIPSACLQQRSHFEDNKKQERENNVNSSSTSKFTQNRSTGSQTNSPPVIGASLPSEPKKKKVPTATLR